MYKELLGLILLVCWNMLLQAQVSPNSKYDCYGITLNGKEVPGIKIPYRSLVINDERPDTLKAGYFYPGTNDKGIKKVCFTNRMTQQLSSFFDSQLQYESESGDSIFACVRKIWFGSYDTTDVKENKLTLRTRKLALKIEFYKRSQDCYFPLYRFDSSINIPETLSRKPSEVLETALIASVRALEKNSYTNNTMLKCLSRQQIDSFNRISKSFPVLNEKMAKKGVYMTVEQFRNNAPAYTEFKLKPGGRSDQLSINGMEGPRTKDAWAVSTGEKMYVRMGANYFEIFKSGSTYDFYGFDTFFRAPSYNSRTTPLGVGLLNMITTKITDFKPFQLNLETGEIY